MSTPAQHERHLVGALLLVLGPTVLASCALVLFGATHPAPSTSKAVQIVGEIMIGASGGFGLGLGFLATTSLSRWPLARWRLRTLLSRWALSTVVTGALLGWVVVHFLSVLDTHGHDSRFIWHLLPSVSGLIALGYAPFGAAYWWLERVRPDRDPPNPPTSAP